MSLDSILKNVSYTILSQRRNNRVELKNIYSTIKALRDLVMSALDYLEKQGFIRIVCEEIKVLDPVGLALQCLKLGMDERILSKHLDWRDFEVFVSKLLEYYDYIVYRNFRFRFKGKRYEVDVLGISHTYSLVVDCKHWRKLPLNTLYNVTARHKERVEALARGYRGGWFEVKGLRKGSKLVPVLITLTSPKIPVINGVLIVPIFMLKGFLDDIYRVVEEFSVELSEI